MSWASANSFARHMKETPSRYRLVNSVNDLQSGDVIAVTYDNSNIVGHLMIVTSHL